MIVILHSDDAGLAPDLTTAMLDALEAGLIDGISVLANGAHLEGLGTRLAGLGRRPRIAVHLNLSEGPPVADPSAVPWLVNRAGQLRLSFGRCLAGLLLCRPRVRRDRIAQIAREWSAQIRRVKALVEPVSVDGLDGHTHIHMLPFVFPVVCDLAWQEGLNVVRVSREVLSQPVTRRDWLKSGFWLNQVKRVVLWLLSIGRVGQLGAVGISSPSAVTGVLYTGEMSRRAILAAIRESRRRRHSSLEVILHVGAGRMPPHLPESLTLVRRLRALEASGLLQRS